MTRAFMPTRYRARPARANGTAARLPIRSIAALRGSCIRSP